MGLFDTAARDQMDMFGDPWEPQVEARMDVEEAEFRAAIERGDLEPAGKDVLAEGEEALDPQDLIRQIDGDTAHMDAIATCRLGRGFEA